MNEPIKHKIPHSPLPEEMKKACCLTCLVADAMKDCKNCPFNKYVTERPKIDAVSTKG